MTEITPTRQDSTHPAHKPQKSKTADQTAIRPFPVPTASDAELADLRGRIQATRWPTRELVSDATQGVQLATMQKLARYWASDFRRFQRVQPVVPHRKPHPQARHGGLR